MGALLAWIIVYKPDQLMRFYKALIIPALISIIIFIFGIIQTKWVTVPMMRPFHSIIALFIIAYIFIRKDRSGIFFSAIWDNKFLIFIGKISYGMYLYHAFLPYIINRGLVTYFNWNAEEFFSPLAYFLMSFLIVVLTAWLSWRLIEKPFLGLKKYFNYSDNTK
jgi:peptidoglycan/LPS O-acetylase OafA/YrhL